MDNTRFIETDAPVVVLQAGQTKLEEAEKLLIIATLKKLALIALVLPICLESAFALFSVKLSSTLKNRRRPG